jgi:hypothetical protein
MNADCFLGLDLGQRMDRSAVALVRPTEITDGVDWARFEARRFPRYDVEYLSRLRAGASYASVVERVRELTRRPELNGHCTVVVDATGVGMPVVEMLRATDLTARVVPVMITGGATAHRDQGIWFVPRRDLMVNLRGILERKELRIAAGSREGGHLIEELANVRWDSRAHSAVHDDLAFALALACWRATFGSVGRAEKGRLL